MIELNDERYNLTQLYSMSEILMFYSAYIETLKRCPFEQIVIDIRNMDVDIPKHRAWSLAARKDGYLNNYKNSHHELAIDIIKNGTYFPVWVTKKSNGRYLVLEGIHRVEAMKDYMSETNCELEFKMFAFIVHEDFYEENNFKEFKTEIYFPVFNIDNEWHKNLFGHHCIKTESNRIAYNEAKQDMPLLIEISYIQEYIDAMFIWHKFLRHAFYKYQYNNGIKIPVSSYINMNRGGINSF